MTYQLSIMYQLVSPGEGKLTLCFVLKLTKTDSVETCDMRIPATLITDYLLYWSDVVHSVQNVVIVLQDSHLLA